MFLKYHKRAIPGKKRKVKDDEKSLDSKQNMKKQVRGHFS